MNWFAKQELLKEAEVDMKNQTGQYVTMGDVNRYSHDAYSIKIYISITNVDCAVSLMASHNYLGTNQYSRFWKYAKNEYGKAQQTYDKLCKIVQEVCEDFISYERPTSLFCPTLRERIQNIDDRSAIKTNIPVVNYSYRIDYSSHWDKNIYGPRYPERKEESFEQYLNSSIYSKTNTNPPTGKFAL